MKRALAPVLVVAVCAASVLVLAELPAPRCAVAVLTVLRLAIFGAPLPNTCYAVDLMGLNNPRMAHAPGDRRGFKNHAAFNRDVFFAIAPDLVIPAETRGPNGAARWRSSGLRVQTAEP